MNILDQWISDIWTVDIHNEKILLLLNVGNGGMGWLLIVIRLSQVIPPLRFAPASVWLQISTCFFFWLRNGPTSLFTVFADRWRYHWNLQKKLDHGYVYWLIVGYIDNHWHILTTLTCNWHNVQKWSWHLTEMAFVEWGTPAKTNQFPRKFAIPMMLGSPIL